jgi:hypothetical protein
MGGDQAKALRYLLTAGVITLRARYDEGKPHTGWKPRHKIHTPIPPIRH